jgi:hypothetical protein
MSNKRSGGQARLWCFPTKNWAAQVSVGHLAHPEALEPGDQTRTTASVAYSKPVSGGSWSSTFIWGRNHKTYTKQDSRSYTVESLLPIRRKNFITGRIEVVDKDELSAGEPGTSTRTTAMPFASAHTRSATHATSIFSRTFKLE